MKGTEETFYSVEKKETLEKGSRDIQLFINYEMCKISTNESFICTRLSVREFSPAPSRPVPPPVPRDSPRTARGSRARASLAGPEILGDTTNGRN